MQQRISTGLAVIDARAMRKAIEEFNEAGRTRFLRRHGFRRSSKFYLLFRERLYDTKALVAAAHMQATGKRLDRAEFAGGTQTLAVFRRLGAEDPDFTEVFKDELGELRNLSTEYDCFPRNCTNLRELGFSNWIPLEKYRDLKTGRLPGVYVVANSAGGPIGNSIIDERVVYVGETVSQSLRLRLYQFCRSIQGKAAHSGGTKLRELGYQKETLWFAMRSFPLGYPLEDIAAGYLRSAQIRHLERKLIDEYVRTFARYTAGNSK